VVQAAVVAVVDGGSAGISDARQPATVAPRAVGVIDRSGIRPMILRLLRDLTEAVKKTRNLIDNRVAAVAREEVRIAGRIVGGVEMLRRPAPGIGGQPP